MKYERDERKFDFHDIGLAIKKAREREGMTQEQLASIIDRDPRTVMYHENDGQHPSLNVFYQLVTMFGLSVDQFFYPDTSADDACKKRIDSRAQNPVLHCRENPRPESGNYGERHCFSTVCLSAAAGQDHYL